MFKININNNNYKIKIMPANIKYICLYLLRIEALKAQQFIYRKNI